MATKIPLATTAYLTSFVDGQGAGASNYFTYADDLDINFLLLRQTVNTMIDEISAVSGPNAIVALDLVLWDDVDNPITAAALTSGVVGPASYEVSVEGGGTLKIKKGQVFVLGQRATLIADLTGVTSSGGAGTRWVAIDTNGVVFIESAAAQRDLDIASVTWDGAIFTGTPTHLAEVFFDGDSWAELRDRPVAGTTFPAKVFRRVSDRVRDIELILSGGSPDPGPRISLPPGAEALPGLVFSDGAGAEDTDTGWYRVSATSWGFSSGGVEVMRLAAAQALLDVLGSEGTPPISFVIDPDTGIYSPGANLLALTVGGTEVLRVGPAQLLMDVIGSAVTPPISFVADPNTGIFSPGANILGFACDSNEILRIIEAQLQAVDGAVGSPAYSFLSEQSGMFLGAASTLSFAVAGVLRFELVGGRQRGGDGTAALPGISFLADNDTGIFRPAANTLAFATANVERARFDSVGNLDLPTNMGAILRRAASQGSIVTATPTNVSWDTEDRDIGGWIAVTATDLTVPTGADGLYLITFSVVWATDGVGERQIHIEAAGATLDPVRDDAGAVGDNQQSTTSIVALVATDIVRGVVEHTVGVNHSIDSARLAIQKIA